MSLIHCARSRRAPCSPARHRFAPELASTPPSLTILSSAPPVTARALLSDLYEAAVAGAAPGPLTTAALESFVARPGQRLWLYAFGKGALAMAGAAAASLQRSLFTIAGGVVVAPEAAPPPYATLTSVAGDHPLPGRHSFAAADRISLAARGMRSDDVALVLMSGGASSLIAAPLRGMSEADLVQLFELLLGSGLDVRQVNAVRKRFTRWGAGRLALALAPARTHVLVVSDVPADDPADVGSGPCAPDPTTVQGVIDLMQRSGVLPRVSPAMREYLNGVARGLIPDTPKRTHPAFAHVSTRVIGTNRLALDAVASRAREHGVEMQRVEAPLTGDAAQAGTAIATALVERARAGLTGGMVWGGETTVQLAHPAAAGGRCQELALAAARVLGAAGEAGGRVNLLAAGTDGRDGPTDASGAFADAGLWDAIAASGRDPALALARHESWAALHAADALLRRGLTGTNVMDVVIGLVQ
jgi:glycerate 2-kinase